MLHQSGIHENVSDRAIINHKYLSMNQQRMLSMSMCALQCYQMWLYSTVLTQAPPFTGFCMCYSFTWTEQLCPVIEFQLWVPLQRLCRTVFCICHSALSAGHFLCSDSGSNRITSAIMSLLCSVRRPTSVATLTLRLQLQTVPLHHLQSSAVKSWFLKRFIMVQ